MTETRSRLTRQADGNDLGLGGPGVAETMSGNAVGPAEESREETDHQVDEELARRLRGVHGVGPASIRQIAGEYPTIETLKALDDLEDRLVDLGIRSEVAERIAAEVEISREQGSAARTERRVDDPLVAQLTTEPQHDREPSESGRTQQIRVDYETYKRLRATVARLEADGRDAPTMTEIATHAVDRWLDLLEGARKTADSTT